ncbi:GTP cyclohydrolase I FolE [Homoserinimonas sp. OAct 916]|uniref:GTP cyclohydrolase I FolE n=1 Tax=Homoserinimonas sp. OAct 916 TaxID=2211450 RepID=UPI000DBE432B|nr:GTP cyclohydrolase I FolE [Homoserinimonas sp. OAct 916]
MGVDRARIERAVAELLSAIGEDPARPELVDTPRRVADAYQEFFAGIDVDPLGHLAETVPLDGGKSDTVIVRGLRFRSICEHHLLPFIGVAHLAYLPSDRIVGLGRLGRVVETLAARPQLQERLTEQIADTLVDGLDPRGVLVVLDAVHGCVTTRDLRQTGSSTVTIVARGLFVEPERRAEMMALIGATRD